MIAEFIPQWDARKSQVEAGFKAAHPMDYVDIVRAVVSILSDGYQAPDPDRIHEINDGDYQGTLVFVIASKGYQPSNYWVVKVSYGSCSGCDTLQAIRGYSEDSPNDDQVADYMVLALHILQGLKNIDAEVV